MQSELNWKELSKDVKSEIVTKLREIKAKHGDPDWFADPQINYLNELNL